MNRIDRLTAILIHLQTKRVVRAEEISGRFEISLRTVYRDVKALMEAGVPIGSEAGKGYFIVDGYHLPPVMFNQEEASALLTAGKLVEKLTDGSIRKAYESALLKIKSVLNNSEKDYLENLQSSVAVFRMSEPPREFPNQFMADIQKAISGKKVLGLRYFSLNKQEETTRSVEPIGIVYYSAQWHLIAWCRLRGGYRDFRTDMIRTMDVTDEIFDPRNHFTLQEYFDSLTRAHGEMEKAAILFDRSVGTYARNVRYYYGFVSEEDLGDKCRMTFLVANPRAFCRWLMMYGKAVEIEHPSLLARYHGRIGGGTKRALLCDHCLIDRSTHSLKEVHGFQQFRIVCLTQIVTVIMHFAEKKTVMRKIILGLAISLDGRIEGPNGEYDWCFTDQDYGMKKFLEEVDAAFYGRKSYELMMGWEGGNPFGNLKSYVFSNTWQGDGEGFELVSGDIQDGVDRIRKMPGKGIWLFGGASLTAALMNAGKVDELWLSVHPIILGPGKPLFSDIQRRVTLELLESKTYETGLLSLRYRVVHAQR